MCKPAVLLIFLHISLFSSAYTQANQPNPTTPEPFSVTGIVLDTQDRPLAGATVELYPALHEGTLTTHTDVNGVYEFSDVPNIPYYVHAWHEITYNGQDYCLRLGMPTPSDYDVFNASAGVVRNFKWQLTGEIPEEGVTDWHFGGWVVLDVYGDMRGGTVELTFTPAGPLLDGSSGTSFTRTFDPQQQDDLYDVPAGTYTVTATLIEPGGGRTSLGLKNDDTYDQEATQHVSLDFDSAGGCSYSNGLTYATLFLYSPYQ